MSLRRSTWFPRGTLCLLGRTVGVTRGTSCLLGARTGSLGAPRVSWGLYMVPSGHLVSLGKDLGRFSTHLVPHRRPTWSHGPRRPLDTYTGGHELGILSWDGFWAFLGALRASWALNLAPSGHFVSLRTDAGCFSGHFVPLGRPFWLPRGTSCLLGWTFGVSRCTSCRLGAVHGSLGAPCVSWGGPWAFVGAPRASWALDLDS